VGIKIENLSCDPDHALLGVVCSRNLYMKFDDSGFSRSRDIAGVPKLKMGHVTLNTPLFTLISHPYGESVASFTFLVCEN